jgi:hypothetical protein
VTVSQGVKAQTVVLVHGGFVDGSGWEGVYHLLRQEGYTVAVVQNPTVSQPEAVAALIGKAAGGVKKAASASG